MIRWVIVGLSLPLLSASALQAQALPTCRVRVLQSAATEPVPRSVFRQIEAWVNTPERGSRLVQTIDEADVLLELTHYRPRELTDGMLGDEWLFVARRLSEASRQRATYRFGYLASLDRKSQARVGKQLPVVLADVCFGYLPTLTSDR